MNVFSLGGLKGNRERRDTQSPKVPVLLNECPEVIGMMAVVLGNGGSLDTAVRKVARSSLKESSRLFTPIVADADTRLRPDMVQSLNDMLSSLPEGASAYVMALRMIVSASNAKDDAERKRLMDEARSIALDGLRDAGKAYSSGLNAPCMVIFSVGIMIPMVLMSVLPMLGVSGLFGGSPVDGKVLTVITLVAIPAVVATVIVSIRRGNPFLVMNKEHLALRDVVPFLTAMPLMLVLLSADVEMYVSLCISLAAGAVAAVLFMGSGTGSSRTVKKKTALLTEAVFDMGNYLLAGVPFEESFRTAVRPRKGCADIAERMDREMMLCRGDAVTAIRNTIDPVSPRLAEVFVEIYRASEGDIRESGRLALTLGRQIMDQESVRRGIRNDLKGMTDTMSGTAVVFAPVVLGLSITILGPLSRLSEDVDVSGTALVLAVYLTELSALIACTVAFLQGNVGVRDILRRFAILLPVSLTVFVVMTMMQL